MRIYRKYNAAIDEVVSSVTGPTNLFSYEVPNTSTIVTIDLKFMVYNVDQAKSASIQHMFTYIVGNVTPAGLSHYPPFPLYLNNYTEAPNSLTPVYNYEQSTGIITLDIENSGLFAEDITCNWSYELVITTN